MNTYVPIDNQCTKYPLTKLHTFLPDFQFLTRCRWGWTLYSEISSTFWSYSPNLLFIGCLCIFFPSN